MEPGTGLTSASRPLSAPPQEETHAALSLQILCLQQLVSELLLKNQRLRQALAAEARVEPADLV